MGKFITVALAVVSISLVIINVAMADDNESFINESGAAKVDAVGVILENVKTGLAAQNLVEQTRKLNEAVREVARNTKVGTSVKRDVNTNGTKFTGLTDPKKPYIKRGGTKSRTIIIHGTKGSGIEELQQKQFEDLYKK